MKNQVIKYAQNLFFFLLAMTASLATYAQDKGLNIDVEIGTEPVWYQQTWVWVVGAAVFVLLLVALLKNNSKK
ncbi:hypothetical protein [Algoriphagus pacificus]|uniref:Uncharacterized protein n=1 Tax=Algoriphagus pacificus TaxID=2811234 RepID=A0ABS3CFJ6_9BACT|nr:hypothetical protein [Algoriphagus pacificus]MBN7814906.1 hypothetical protein [Algoriphagus pacificus]